MEFWAWFMHKYVQHGPLWFLHRSHHVRHPHPVERNDLFFLIYGAHFRRPCSSPATMASDWWFWVGVGIAAYGTVYFFVHDVLIHGRLRFWKKIAEHLPAGPEHGPQNAPQNHGRATAPKNLACCGYRPNTLRWPAASKRNQSE